MPVSETSTLKIAFMGTPDFASSALKALIESGHEVAVVYSQPPRPKGRGHKVQKSPVQILAEENNIPVYTPKSLKSQEVQEEFASHDVDVAIVAAYGLLLPEAVLNAPKYGCLNIHGSLLPKWRGAAPIQYSIWKGDDKSGVTIMQMDKGMDTGAMILKGEVPIVADTTAASLHDDLAGVGASLVLDVLGKLASEGFIDSEVQEEDQSSYASLLKKSDGEVDWNQNAIEIDRQVRALNPWPGVRSGIDGKQFKILQTEVGGDLSNAGEGHGIGKIIDKSGIVSCGEGSALKIISIQPEGKKAMDFASVLNGNYLKVGSIFS